MNYTALILTCVTGGIAAFFLVMAAMQGWKIAEQYIQELNNHDDEEHLGI